MKWKLLLESEFLPTTHCSEDELSVLSQTIIVMTVLHFLLKRFDWGGKKNRNPGEISFNGTKCLHLIQTSLKHFVLQNIKYAFL